MQLCGWKMIGAVRTPVRYWVRVLFLAAVSLFPACAANPPQDVNHLCPHCRSIIISPAAQLPLIAYVKVNPSQSESAFIHVYLEGDGQPWIRGRWPAKNPSSRQLTALKLMMLDPHPAIYLNRPCYGYKFMPEHCSDELWTSARYGPEIVDAMAFALTDFATQYPGKRWILIGHSGGGVLAMLLAEKVENVAAVVTLAANLDHQAWTNIKGFAPLNRSLNPVDQEPLPANVMRWHFAGGRDLQVPPQITSDAAASDSGSQFFFEPEFDHSCCWEQIWPRILRELDAQLTGTK